MLPKLTLVIGGIFGDRRGQDLVEYALAAAFVALAASAFFPPSIAPAISAVFSKIVDVFAAQP